TGAITTTTSFYIESYFCNEVTARTELKVTVNPPPTITITGNTRSIDSVTLTASGGTSFLWSGGTSKTTAQNTFTTSGTYTVTVQKEGCVNTASVEVTTNVAGINKDGNLLSDRNDNLNKYGAAGTETKVDRYGKIYDNGDGNSATNNGLAFDGINDFVTAPSAVYFKGDLTIECWVYPRSFGNWARIID